MPLNAGGTLTLRISGMLKFHLTSFRYRQRLRFLTSANSFCRTGFPRVPINAKGELATPSLHALRVSIGGTPMGVSKILSWSEEAVELEGLVPVKSNMRAGMFEAMVNLDVAGDSYL